MIPVHVPVSPKMLQNEGKSGLLEIVCKIDLYAYIKNYTISSHVCLVFLVLGKDWVFFFVQGKNEHFGSVFRVQTRTIKSLS